MHLAMRYDQVMAICAFRNRVQVVLRWLEDGPDDPDDPDGPDGPDGPEGPSNELCELTDEFLVNNRPMLPDPVVPPG